MSDYPVRRALGYEPDEEYPLRPTESDLERESLDAQEPVISLGDSAEHRANAEMAALRFNLREWQDRARDMELERDEALRVIATHVCPDAELTEVRAQAVAALREVLVPGRSIAVAQWFATRALQEIEHA